MAAHTTMYDTEVRKWCVTVCIVITIKRQYYVWSHNALLVGTTNSDHIKFYDLINFLLTAIWHIT